MQKGQGKKQEAFVPFSGWDDDSESEGGSIADPEEGDVEGSDSEAESEWSAATTVQPAQKTNQTELRLPNDPDDPSGNGEVMSASTRARLDAFFEHISTTASDEFRPAEPEWQPEKTVQEWADIIWMSVPGALRWWVDTIESMAPTATEHTCLAMLQELVVGQSDEHRFGHIRALFLSQGCPSEHEWFLDSRETVFRAFPRDTFGKAEYRWDAEITPIEKVLSVIDCFVTLCEAEPIPEVLAWDPITRVQKPVNWKAGGVHEPEVVKRWEEMPGCAKRVLGWVRDKVFIKPTRRPKLLLPRRLLKQRKPQRNLLPKR